MQISFVSFVEFDEMNEENWFDRIFSVEYEYNVAVSDPFCVSLSPSGDQQDVNALPTALVLTMRITPHLSTAVVSTARRKKQKRRKKTADLERMTLTFQVRQVIYVFPPESQYCVFEEGNYVVFVAYVNRHYQMTTGRQMCASDDTSETFDANVLEVLSNCSVEVTCSVLNLRCCGCYCCYCISLPAGRPRVCTNFQVTCLSANVDLLGCLHLSQSVLQ